MKNRSALTGISEFLIVPAGCSDRRLNSQADAYEAALIFSGDASTRPVLGGSLDPSRSVFCLFEPYRTEVLIQPIENKTFIAPASKSSAFSLFSSSAESSADGIWIQISGAFVRGSEESLSVSRWGEPGQINNPLDVRVIERAVDYNGAFWQVYFEKGSQRLIQVFTSDCGKAWAHNQL